MTESPYDACYVTQAEAEAYFANSSRGLEFLDIDEALQIGFLVSATLAIDSLPLRGELYESQSLNTGVLEDLNNDGFIQKFAFPRVIDGTVVNWDRGLNKPVVPIDVKRACMEEALSLCRAGLGGRAELQEQNVASFNLGGKLQESFTAGAGMATLMSRTAKTYMRKYQGAKIH